MFNAVLNPVYKITCIVSIIECNHADWPGTHLFFNVYISGRTAHSPNQEIPLLFIQPCTQVVVRVNIHNRICIRYGFIIHYNRTIIKRDHTEE